MREIETENYGTVTLRSAIFEDEQGNPFDALEIEGEQVGYIEVEGWYDIDELEVEKIEELIERYD